MKNTHIRDSNVENIAEISIIKIYKAVIYCRLSNEDGDKTVSNSITTQKLFCEDFASKQDDIEIVHDPIIDDGVSGTTHNRQGFIELENGIKSGLFDCVIVKDLSRFSRNYIDAGRYIEQIFPELGIRFIAIADNYDSLNSNTATDSYIIPFKNLINDAYCKDISIKIRSSIESKKKNGEFVSSFAPYGYKKSADNHNKLVVDENVRGNIELIFSLYKDGISIGNIAKQFNEMGILSPLDYKQSIGIKHYTAFKTSKVARWEYNTIKRILTNEVYIGTLVQGKKTKVNYKVNKSIDNDKSSWIRVENTHEAIVGKDDFNIIQMLMGRDMRYVTESKNGKNMLSGLVFCSDCGATMIRRVVNYKSKKYVYYTCGSYLSDKNCCSSHSIKTEHLEEYILQAIKSERESRDGVDEENFENIEIKQVNYDDEIIRLNDEIEETKKVKLRVYKDYTDKVLSRNEYFEYIEEYATLIDNKKKIINDLEERRKEIENIDYNDWKSKFSISENVDVLSRGVLLDLVDKIIIYSSEKIKIDFRVC